MLLELDSFRCVTLSSAPAAIWFSVPENHHVCLPCGSSGSSDVIWTLQDQEVLVTRRGGYKTNKDRRRYLLMVNGGLCVLRLEESDHGRYRCNQQLVAELQVLTGMLGVEPPGWSHQGGKQIRNAGKDEERKSFTTAWQPRLCHAVQV